MAKVDVFKKNMDSDMKVSGLMHTVPPKKWVFTVSVQFDDKIFKEIKDDSILLEDMNKEVNKIYDQLCAMVAKKLMAFDKMARQMLWEGATAKEVETQLDGLNKALEQDKDVSEKAADIAVKDVWKKYAAKKKEYLKYKVKIVASITGSVAGLVTSVVMMGTGGFTAGASGVLGIVSMIKSVVQISKEIASAAMDVETASKILEKQLAVVEKAAKNLLATKANEYVGIIAQQFLGISQPTIQNCRAQVDTIEKKLIGIEIDLHKSSKQLNSTLDELEDFKSDFLKQVKVDLGKHPSEKATTQINPISNALNSYLAETVTQVNDAIKKVEDIHSRWEEAEGVLKPLKKRVEEVSGKQTVDETLLRNIIVLVDIPLGLLNGDKISKATGDVVSGLVPTLVGLKYDKIVSKVLEGTLLE